MTQDEQKRAAAKAAIQYVPVGCIIGVGTGSYTAEALLEAGADVAYPDFTHREAMTVLLGGR